MAEDWIARGIGLGSLVVGLALVLAFVRHRREPPKLRLDVERIEGDQSPYDVTFTLYNEGRVSVRVSNVQNATLTEGVVFLTVPLTPLPQAQMVRGLDYAVWAVRWSVLATHDRPAEFVVTVRAVRSKPASVRFVLKPRRIPGTWEDYIAAYEA